MNNNFDKSLKIVQAIANGVNEFVNSKEFQMLATTLVAGLNQLQDFSIRFYSYSQSQKKMYIEMSQHGWFPSYITFKTPINDGESPDDYMIRCLTDNLEDIKELLINSYPHRKHIFKEAFSLFDEERYIAALPLFMSQLDGLSAEYDLSPFFTRTYPKTDKKNLSEEEKIKLKKFPEYLKAVIEKKLLGKNQILILYYQEVIFNACNSFISKNTDELDMNESINILNRHGILHGHREFLGYGNSKNCLKIISLILFVDHILSLLYGNNDQTNQVEENLSLEK